FKRDGLEIGTIDAPEWKIEEPNKRFAARAVAARGGLWGNHGYEAAYFLTSNDSAGETPDGDGRYGLRLATPPPVERSGRSRCTTCRGSTSWTTRSTGTPSATAPPAS